MKEFLKKHKILIGAILILVILSFVALKTRLPKRLLDHFNKDLIEQRDKIVVEKKEIEKQRIKDSIRLTNALNWQKNQTDALRSQYNNTLKTLRKYEEALNSYRTGNFAPNFITFTGNVTSADTLSVEGFNFGY